MPAAAMGFGPLAEEGLTDGPRKDFYLTLVNPHEEPRRFELRARSWTSERPFHDLHIIPAAVTVEAGQRRRVLVVFNRLGPGETARARVCARPADAQSAQLMRPRICSRLTAHRMP